MSDNKKEIAKPVGTTVANPTAMPAGIAAAMEEATNYVPSIIIGQSQIAHLEGVVIGEWYDVESKRSLGKEIKATYIDSRCCILQKGVEEPKKFYCRNDQVASLLPEFQQWVKKNNVTETQTCVDALIWLPDFKMYRHLVFKGTSACSGVNFYSSKGKTAILALDAKSYAKRNWFQIRVANVIDYMAPLSPPDFALQLFLNLNTINEDDDR